MKRVKLCLAVVSALATTSGALAQPTPAAPAGPVLSAAEQTALLPLKQAVDARNWAMAASLIPTARSAARTDDARYVLGRLQLDVAIGTQNRAARSEAINMILGTGEASSAEQVDLLRHQASLAYDAGNLSGAEGSLNRAIQIAPNDAEALSMLGQVHRNRNNPVQGLGFFQRALRAAELSGRALPESRYRLALAMAEQTAQRGVALEIARQLLAAYPSPANWRDVLIIFRTVGTVDPAQTLDALRLARAAGALTGERDYMALATALDQAGLPAEAKAVVDEGVTRRILTASDSAPRTLVTAATPRITRERAGLAGQLTTARGPTATATQARTAADAHLAHGRYADAAELYRLALLRAEPDPGLVNTRLGIALAMAGQRADAEAAFRSVAGPRGELAALWALWLARRPVS